MNFWVPEIESLGPESEKIWMLTSRFLNMRGTNRSSWHVKRTSAPGKINSSLSNLSNSFLRSMGFRTVSISFSTCLASFASSSTSNASMGGWTSQQLRQRELANLLPFPRNNESNWLGRVNAIGPWSLIASTVQRFGWFGCCRTCPCYETSTKS